MPLPVQELFLLPLFPEELPHLIDRRFLRRLIEELNDKLQTHHLIFLPAPVPSALLQPGAGPALLILTLSKFDIMQQVLKALFLFLHGIVCRLVVVADPVYVCQEL